MEPSLPKDPIMLKTILRFLALTTAIASLGTVIVMGAASAATPTGAVPVCSKTITDKCMDPGAAPKGPARHPAAHAVHHARHQADRHAATANHDKG